MTYNGSEHSFHEFCFNNTSYVYITVTQLVTRTSIFTPLSVFILHSGFQRWRQQEQPPTKTSHSDVFTVHLALFQLLFCLGTVGFLSGYFTNHSVLTTAGLYINAVFFPAEVCLHMLTCVERYLAVVHPVTYRGSSRSGGVRIRNVSIASTWVLCIGWIPLVDYYYPSLPDVPFFCLLVLAVIVVFFCSLAALCVLNRPGPGDRRGPGRAKLRAFHTVSTLAVVLLVFFVAMLAGLTMNTNEAETTLTNCVTLALLNWLSFPCHLALPSIFILRAGKAPGSCCRLK